MSEAPRIHRPPRKSTGELLKVWGPLLVLVGIGFAIAIAKLEPPAPRSLAIAAGSPGGAYHAYAERYREILARDGFDLQVVETAGSAENLQLLAAGDVSLALLQGGTRLGAAGDAAPSGAILSGELEALASLFFEPVWVFHRADKPLELLSDMAGWRLAIGAPGSGTRALAMRLLADNGIDEATAELLPLASIEAAAALEEGSVDAAIFVASTDAEYVRHLVGRQDVALLSIRRSLAYRKAHPFLSRVILGQGVLDIDLDLPPEDVTLVAAAASLVARRDLHHALVPLLLQAMDEVHGGVSLLDTPQSFPAMDYVEHPLKAEAEHYLTHGPSFLQRYLGHRAAATADRLKILLVPLITLLIPVFKTAPPIYRWRIRSKIYRWYEDLRWADEILHENPTDEEIAAHSEALAALEREVAQVEVPLSYMDEYYSLRVHIRMIAEHLERLRDQGAAGASTSSSGADADRNTA